MIHKGQLSIPPFCDKIILWFVVNLLLQVFPGAVSAVAAAAGVKPNISLQQQLYQQRLQVRTDQLVVLREQPRL